MFRRSLKTLFPMQNYLRSTDTDTTLTLTRRHS